MPLAAKEFISSIKLYRQIEENDKNSTSNDH